jgi:hypothetical protein
MKVISYIVGRVVLGLILQVRCEPASIEWILKYCVSVSGELALMAFVKRMTEMELHVMNGVLNNEV